MQQKGIPSKTTLPYLGLAGLFLIVEYLAFNFRFLRITRPFEQGEYLHFMPALTGRHLANAIEKAAPTLQPLGDFLLQRFLWIPLFGYKELPLRFHALLTSLAMIALVIAVTARYLRSTERSTESAKASNYYAWAATFAVALWATVHPTETHNATLVRPYALVAFVSLFWWAAWLLFTENTLSWRFFWLSLVFANTHFFALVLVAGAYGLGILQSLLDPGAKHKADVIPLIRNPLLILAISVFLNRTAILWLMQAPPTTTADFHAGKVLLAALQLWWEYFLYAAWPFGILLAVIVLTIAALPQRVFATQVRVRLCFACVAIQPALYILCRLKSDYTFSQWYHSVFFGLAAATLVLAFDGARKLIALLANSRKKGRKPPPSTLAAAQAAVVLLLSYPALQTLAATPLIPKDALLLQLKNFNFSDNYREQAIAQATRLPILWLHDSCWESDNPLYYLGNNSSLRLDPQEYTAAYPYGFLVVDLRGCEHDPKAYAPELRRFYESYTRSILVLRMQEGRHADCKAHFPRQIPPGIKIDLLPETLVTHCTWMVHGVQDLRMARTIADGVGFSYNPAFFELDPN